VGRKAGHQHGYEEEAHAGAVVRKLATADRMLNEGKDYRWHNQVGGMNADDAKRLKDLERENATLKRLLADAELEKAALREIPRGNF
jgi:putative transposase